MKKFVGLVVSAVAVIGLSSCGGDDGGIGSAGGSGDAKKVTDALVSSAAESDVTIDEACVSDVVNKLSAADLTLVVDNLEGLVDGSVDMTALDISDEGIATLESTFDCVAGS
ncbi:unannotated protein [freshwater metagenome]|uniref:Unannotated protein n=1 Tax=freshwater metagenome TaxID=449393 RepID=A0A6J6QU35_9ZZZZ|nr:hypothetical protein [Actinomycetota bacterium]MSX15304.1 hypothetical protein [Actinomycetota bacterium]MSX36576.1 hypothetical protein [Actinomycetota bacterium]MSZ71236.1 hypothetical protein [Actinomycetota bacterium]MUH55918.1 hypothetical protein [Actinomycetota bacterium]